MNGEQGTTQLPAHHSAACTCARGGIRWRAIVSLLLFVTAWDTLGLLIGERFYASPSYEVLRDVADLVTIGGHTLGMRLYGVLLGAIGAGVTWALMAQRRRDGRTSRLLSLGLSMLAAWWVMWTFGIVAAFIANGEIYAWGGIGKLLAISRLAIIVARVPPPLAVHEPPAEAVDPPGE